LPEKNSPVTVKETVREYRERIIYLEREPKKAANDDPLAIAIAALMCLMFLAWGYVSYSETILSYLLIFLLTTISFSATTIVVSTFKGHFNSESWWFYTIFPFLQLLFCIYLLSLAWNSMDPKVIEIAKKTSAIAFYTENLSEEGLYFVVTQLLGVTALFIVVLLTALVETYYLALMNQRGKGAFTRLWEIIVQLTWRFSGRGTLTGSIFLSITSFLLLGGYVTNWITNQ
jgi:hypothetical protein